MTKAMFTSSVINRRGFIGGFAAVAASASASRSSRHTHNL